MQEDVFLSSYRGLNKEQKEAVDTIDGPVMVIAGPGTGKTSILTLRIANILRCTDTSPDSILALTFTESGVFSMRQKLVGIIGAAAYRVNIFTFHGFSNFIIENYPEYFPRVIGGALASEVDQLSILETILQSQEFEIIKPYGNIFYYVKPILSTIRSLKRENISPSEFSEFNTTTEKDILALPDLRHQKGKYKGEIKGEFKTQLKKIEKNKELARVYEQYETKLAAARLFDYEDMIIETINSLRQNPELLLMLQEEYQYVLADEHQDANNAQNAILELISGFHDNPNLFIVGDEKQAIYRFQGASLENFLYFKRKYPEAKLITLTSNYRSLQPILDAAHTLITSNTAGDALLRKELTAFRGSGSEIVFLREFETADDEIKFITSAVSEKLELGLEPHDIAVLYRDNADAFPLLYSFERTEIPFVLYSDDDVLKDEYISKIILLLRTVHDFGNDELLSQLLFVDLFEIEPIDVYRIMQFCKQKKVDLFGVIGSKENLKNASVQEWEKIYSLYMQLSEWSKLARNAPLLKSVESIIRESKFIEYALSQDGSLAILEKLDSLLLAVKSMVEVKKNSKLKDFIYYIDTLETHGSKIEKKKRQTFENRVSLMTAHRSKGLEYKVVFVTGLTDGKWGNKRSVEHFLLPLKRDSDKLAQNDDERRLFYVALTRAKNEVHLSYARSNREGKQKIKSQFVEEILPHLSLGETKVPVGEHPLTIAPRPHGPEIRDQQYLRKLFLEQGLNVTAINNFLDCPWRYFFENLIRLPRSPQKHQMYGIAVHAALREEIEQIKKGEKADKKRLLESYERNLFRQPLAIDDFEETCKKGLKSLAGYYDKYHMEWNESMIPELSIAGVTLKLHEETEILLRGQIDRLDEADGGVIVVDYKTGSAKSRGEIIGDTQSSEGNIKRQLDFYKLLLDLHDGGRYRMTQGRVDFIEPSQSGNYKSEYFEVTEDDTKNITALVLEKAEEIYTFKFWSNFCDDPKCKYCQLRKGMKEFNPSQSQELPQ
jgi:DNA helicase II / ATP-dependent DNA helicase PcrA